MIDGTARLVARIQCPHCSHSRAVAFFPDANIWRCHNCGAGWEQPPWPKSG